MTTTNLIDIRDLHCGYPGSTTVLTGLDFVVRPGEKLGLIGPNGSGKTTFLHAVMGLLAPESGRITLFGREMKTRKDFEQARLQIGFLFQHADDQLFSPTVLDDVAFGPLNQGLTRDQARDTAMRTLEMLGLEGFEKRVPYRLSGGEKRLVALATILAMKPKVLLLDEPTTGLDVKTKARLADILRGLDMAMVTVSHEPDFLALVADRLYALRDGRAHDGGLVAHEHVHVHMHGDVPHSHEDR